MEPRLNFLIAAYCTCIRVLICGAKLPGMLYPRESEYRAVRHLDGMWNFRVDASPTRNESFIQQWYSRPLAETGEVMPMPVPSSYNDIMNDKSLRDFVGWAWYDTTFFVDQSWNRRVVLRFDSAHYYTIVWVNGREVMRHDGGHLPFEAEIYHSLGANRVTVAVNNTLTPTTLPPGTIKYENDTNRYPPGYFVQNVQMDFFNYAGIHRHVTLYTTSDTGRYIEDIDIVTDITGTDGIVNFTIYRNEIMDLRTKVEIINQAGVTVAQSAFKQGSLVLQDAIFWWPYTMNSTHSGYLYTLKVTLWGPDFDTQVYDIYRQPFGIRTVRVTDTSILINGRPFYCRGVNKHEDSDIRGKGLDYALIARDFAMMKWLGANCFRTSHYPYAEEIMDQADQQGFVVIDESPGVGIEEHNFGPVSLAHHIEVMSEMYQRDKNRPSVIMWSVANEPQTYRPEAGPYFKAVIDHVKSLDNTRPVTFVCNQDYNTDVAIPYVDIILVNRYYGWYSDNGHTEVIGLQLDYDFRAWHAKYNRPVILSEYGADTVAGLHQEPSFVFTEEFQVDFLTEYHKVLDKLKKEFVVGEMVWNFADFMTVQGVIRVVGNKKGLLTRQRQPKMAAQLIRDRYMSMDKTANNVCY